MKAAAASAILFIHLPVLGFSIHSFAFMIICYYKVKHVISNFRGQDADRLHWQGFRGKYRSRARMIFPRNLQGPTLQVETGGSATFAPELE